MDRRLPISPIPNNLRKNLDSLKEPYSAEGYQGTKATDKDRTKDRTYHTRRDDDTVGNIKVDLKDNDSVIPYYFENVIKPTVVKEGNLIDVPLVYGGSEIWKTVQRDGYYRDKESKIQVPLIMFKRNTVTKRRDIGNKLDGNQAHLFQTFEKKYTTKNQYDNFDILNNRSPAKEYHAVVVPDYVTLTYDCIIWTEYVENMNKLVEAINFASDSYWGDPNRWKFKATIDSFQNQTEVTVGGNRIVRTTFTLTLNGYLIPDVYNKALANKTKFSSITNINFTDEQFILQNAQSQPQPAVSTFTTTGPGALSGGGTSISAFPFTGNAVISGSLTVSGSFVDFTGATAISGSIFSGSFVGDGSGLTGVISSSYATTSSYAFYAVSASHEIIKEVSSSYADTASFAQSGNGIFSGSFSGSFEGNGSGLTNIPATGIVGLNLSQIASGSSTASISPNGGLFVNTNITSSGNISASGFISASYFVGDGSQLTNVVSSSYALTASYAENAGEWDGTRNGDAEISGSLIIANNSDPDDVVSEIKTTGNYAVYIDPAGNNGVNSQLWVGAGDSTIYSVNPPSTGYNSVSGSIGVYSVRGIYTDGNIYATQLSGSFEGEGSGITGIVSSSYALTASYAVSASHEIIKEVSSSYADTASFAQSGNGLFSGSFSGSYTGDGSGLTGVDPFPFSGTAVITGSLLVSGSSKPLEIIGSGSTVFSIVGSLGELFAIDDQLSGSLLVVNNISGLPQFEVFSDGRTLIGAEPRSLYTTAVISSTAAATSQSIYSLSTSSYDGVFFDYTVTSASNARAGNIMSIWNGGNLVYTENSTTDIGSTAGVTFNVEISQSQAQLISLTDTAGWKIKTTIRSI